MKVFLVHRERDMDSQEEPPTNHETLAQDPELETLIGAMADGDKFVGEVARSVVPRGLTDPDAIAYRQGALADCLRRPNVVGQMYEIAL